MALLLDFVNHIRLTGKPKPVSLTGPAVKVYIIEYISLDAITLPGNLGDFKKPVYQEYILVQFNEKVIKP
jgi:hypothetical protein